MKKVLIIILVAILTGSILAYIVFKGSINVKAQNNTVPAKAFQIGAYNSLDNAKRVANRNNGLVVSDNNIYRVYIAILINDEAISKIENYFTNLNITYVIKDINISSNFVTNLNTYEELIIRSSSDTYSTILKNIISEYGVNYELYD